MEKAGMIGVDLGKRSFRLRGVRERRSAVFRKKVSRERCCRRFLGTGHARWRWRLAGTPATGAGSCRRWGSRFAWFRRRG